jgi:hypothetical protein
LSPHFWAISLVRLVCLRSIEATSSHDQGQGTKGWTLANILVSVERNTLGWAFPCFPHIQQGTHLIIFFHSDVTLRGEAFRIPPKGEFPI